MAANAYRGEVEGTLGGRTVLLCCTMAGLARLSTALGHPFLQDMLARIVNQEPVAVLAGVEALVSGDGAAVRAALRPHELPAAASLVAQALVLAFRDPDGKKSDPAVATA